MTEIAKGIHMCGYVCIGCGRCGKPRTMELPDVKCLKCGTLNEPGATRCSSCGAAFAAPRRPRIESRRQSEGSPIAARCSRLDVSSKRVIESE